MSASLLVSAAPLLGVTPIRPPLVSQPVRPPDSLFPLSCRGTTLGPPFPALRSWAGHRHPHRPTQDLLPLSEAHCDCFILSLREFYPYHLTGFLSVCLGPTWSFPLYHKSTLGLNRAFREKLLCETEAFDLCTFHKIPWSGKKPSVQPYLKSGFSAM